MGGRGRRRRWIEWDGDPLFFFFFFFCFVSLDWSSAEIGRHHPGVLPQQNCFTTGVAAVHVLQKYKKIKQENEQINEQRRQREKGVPPKKKKKLLKRPEILFHLERGFGNAVRNDAKHVDHALGVVQVGLDHLSEDPEA